MKLLIKKREDVGTQHLNDLNVFTECSNTMNKNIDEYNPNRKRKILIVFDDMVADITTNKRFQAIVKELFVRCRKLNISLVLSSSLIHFSVPKYVRLNSTHYLIMKINSRKELQKTAKNHSADIDYKDFVKIYRECIKKVNSFLTINTTLPARNPLWFRKNFFNLIKMTVTDQPKIIDNKIKADQARYDLDRLAAKISASSSGDLTKYKYLTGEDWWSVVEPDKFDYSPFGKVFNEEFTERDKKK